MRIGVLDLPSTSGGARALLDQLASAWSSLGSSHEVVQVSWKDAGSRAIGELSRRSYPSDLQAILCPGNRVVRSSTPVIWWPLTVAPLERPTRREMSADALGAVKFRAMLPLLKLGSLACDGVAFSSCYARGLYGARYPRLLEIPSVILHPAPSIDLVGGDEKVEGLDRGFILSVSTLNRYKRVVEIIQGLALAEVPDHVELVFAGRFPDSAYEEAAHRAAQSLKNPSRVRFLGHCSEMQLRWLYRNAGSFVFASVSENAASYALIDAMAHGLPAASSGRSSMPEITGRATQWLDPDDPKTIAKALEVVNSKDEAADLGKRGETRAAGLPSWSQIAADLELLVNRCQSTKGPS